MLSAVMLTVASCKKSNDDEGTETKTSCQLTSSTNVITGGASGSFSYNYDGDGKITKYVLTGVQNANTTVYTYSASQITEVTTYVNNGTPTTGTVIYNRDSQGRIISIHGSNSSTAVVSNTNFIYNTDGYLSQSTYIDNLSYTSNNPIIEKFTYANGNLIGIEEVDDNKATLTYGSQMANDNYIYPDRTAYLPDEQFSPLRKFLGKQSKNLISKITVDNGDADTFTYQLDGNSNVSSTNITSTYNSNFTQSNTYNGK